ncbi:MAG: hypothetical protein R3E95_13805 [Thiolinea sp.]
MNIKKIMLGALAAAALMAGSAAHAGGGSNVSFSLTLHHGQPGYHVVIGSPHHYVQPRRHHVQPRHWHKPVRHHAQPRHWRKPIHHGQPRWHKKPAQNCYQHRRNNCHGGRH